MKRVRIWKRESRGQWYGEYWDGGKRHAKSLGTHERARRWQAYMTHRINYEDWLGIVGIPWQTLIDLYLDEKAAAGISEAQTVQIKLSITQFESLIGAIRSDRLASHHIRDFKRRRPDNYLKRGPKSTIRTVANRTINKDLETLRALIRWGVKNHYVHDGIEIVMLPTVHRKFIPPTAEQLAELFAAARTCSPLYVRMVLAIVLGARRSAIERISLAKSDPYHIDLVTGQLRTYESKVRTEIVAVLGPTTLAIVRAYAAELPDGCRLLFPRTWDQGIRGAWQRARKSASLPKFTFHNLRNVSASLLADQGESGSVIQAHLGHRNLSTTQRYIGVADAARSRVAAKLDETIRGLL